MPRGGLAALLPALALAAAGCGSGGDGAADGPAPRGRRVLAAHWETVWSVGGDLADTILQAPAALAAGPGGVYVADAAAHRIVRIGVDGHRAWVSGREGAGPGEFGLLRALAADEVGRAWILDRGNARITVLDTSGVLVREIPLPEEARSADGLVPEPGGNRVRVALYDRDRPLALLDGSGRVLRRSPFPWPGYARLHPLASQFVLAGGPGGTRAVALAMGDGFWVGDAGGWRPWRGRYVEPVPFPRVETRRSRAGGARTVEERILDDPPVFAAAAAALTRDRLLILFRGTSRRAGRLLDAYRLSDGAYAGTLVLPAPCVRVAVSDGLVYAITSELVPRVVAWRRREGRLP